MVYVLFVLGFALLVKGADWLVESSSALARRAGISDLVIGLTIVAFGTSLPELTVNLIASFEGNADIALGNIFGSNIANILLILGISALVRDLPVKRPTVLSEIPFSLAAVLLVGFFANSNLFLDERYDLTFDRIEGMIVLLFFFLFMAYIYDMAVSDRSMSNNHDNPDPDRPAYQHILLILAGLFSLFLGGRWVVEGAVDIARMLGMSESLIGLTIVAVGTSLPELVTSVVAARRGKSDIAIGNVIGSNIFNLLWVLALSATILPLPFDPNANKDILMIVFSTTLVILAMVVNRRLVITRKEGVVFLACYIGYTAYLIWRG